MNKPLVKRSQFILINTLVSVSQLIEADEVYVTQVLPSATPMKIQRQREKDLAALIADNSTAMTGGAIQTYVTLDTTYGRVNLDNPADVDGKLTNKVVTTTAGDLKQADRNPHASVGMKERVTFAPVAANTQSSVLIELVHYIPAGEISA
ncbi:hypothetical protein [Spirosoma endophyticum]|uniref:Uncharacterized protein n=1 Tax=Spirosoma endophyticum TaxID=662367 RepID=A0A1I1UAE8_9BACT|nr:hypothetical protein [Spirosoma endophyticum]SFD67664.1 hypothetical protein SAMN05216167_106187 [Spirosoma endophyticum]